MNVLKASNHLIFVRLPRIIWNIPKQNLKLIIRLYWRTTSLLVEGKEAQKQVFHYHLQVDLRKKTIDLVQIDLNMSVSKFD